MGALTQIVCPSQCVLLFGLPTTDEEFQHDLRHAVNDFAIGNGDVPRLWRRLLADFRATITILKRMGVDVRQGADSNELRKTFVSRPPVVILFSHHKADTNCVELRDGLHDARAIVDTIPVNYRGLIDLTVCQAANVATYIRAERLGVHVKWSRRELDPRLWLWFYVSLFALLKDANMTYVDAFELTLDNFRRSSQKV